MENIELKSFGVVELNSDEKKKIEGGGFMIGLLLGWFIGMAIAAFVNADEELQSIEIE